MTNHIDAAFKEAKEKGKVTLANKYINDIEFKYLLTKETHNVTELDLSTC